MSLDALRLLHEAFALKAEPVLELVKVFRRAVNNKFVTELPKPSCWVAVRASRLVESHSLAVQPSG